MTLRSPRVCCWTVHSVTDGYGLSHVQRTTQGLLLLYMEREQESDCMCETQQHVLICGAVGADGVMVEHHRQLLDVIAQEAVACRAHVTEEGERIAEAATGYKRRTVTGTRTQLAITLYTGMSLQLNLTRVTKQPST